ncbi:MAG: class F sortase [Ktedonobacteraceae bacterium]|nr:class F sortase [Ktedonobacteraceae bacterium]
MDKRIYASYCTIPFFCLLIAVSITLLQKGVLVYGREFHSIAVAPGTKPTVKRAAVAHLLIPGINVNAPVELVETNMDGSLEVPKVNVWTGVGLYADGPYPGEQGSAVIDGHLDRPGGYPAVFWNLRLLHKGDIVKVETPGQATMQFRVTQVASYTPASAPLAAIFDNTNGHFLNLITCSGRWIPAIHQTTHRLVVYTTMIKA